MRITKKVLEEQEIETNRIYNKCGKECTDSYKNHLGLECLIDGCYGSEYFEDGTKYTFDLCEKCSYELVKTFIIEPTIIE